MAGAWSAATSFLGLMFGRIGVGLGEAGATPSSQTRLGDLFGFNERLFAGSIFAVGAAVGSMLGTSVGGTINDAWGWRSAFLALAVPSLLRAPLLLLTCGSPRRAPPWRSSVVLAH